MGISEALARALSGGLSTELNRAEVWVPWAIRASKVLIIFFVAWLVSRLARRLLRRLHTYIVLAVGRHGSPTSETEKRARTIVAVASKVIAILVWMVALVMALNELSYNIQPLLAGLGVAGLAVGLGAQTLIKDWLGGLFLLMEDQLRIGDGVTINGISGSVEEINLRTTVLRAESGAVHVIPNGSIATLSNATREYAYAMFETTLAHRADANRALEMLAKIGVAMAEDEKFQPMILAPMEVMGVDRLTVHGAVIRARVKTLASRSADVGRELNLRVKTAYDAAGIAFPPVS